MSKRSKEPSRKAKSLIDRFMSDLRDLEDPVSKSSVAYIKQELPKERCGRKPKPGRQLSKERRQEVAKRMVKHRRALRRNRSKKNISAFAEDLAQEYGIDRADVFKYETKWRYQIIPELLGPLLQVRFRREQRRQKEAKRKDFLAQHTPEE